MNRRTSSTWFLRALISCFLFQFAMQSCTAPLLTTKKIPLPEASRNSAIKAIKTYSSEFTGARGRFSAHVFKPGFDISFKGVFILNNHGVLRAEVYSPYGTLTNFLDIQGETFRYAGQGEIIEGNTFDTLAVLENQWGLILAPYHIFTLFSGSFIDLTMYRFTDEAFFIEQSLVQLELLCQQNRKKEKVDYNLKNKKIMHREIDTAFKMDPISVSYSYHNKGDMPSEAQRCLKVLPHQIQVHQIKGHARIVITLSEVMCLNQSQETVQVTTY